MIIHYMWVTIISDGIVYCRLNIYLCYMYYHIVGFVCEVLICANYDVMGLQKLILCVLIMLLYFCFLTRCRILHTHGYSTNCLLDCLPMSLTSTSRDRTFLPHCLIRKVLCQTIILSMIQRVKLWYTTCAVVSELLEAEFFTIDYDKRIYHICKNVWSSFIGEVLYCCRDVHNPAPQSFCYSFSINRSKLNNFCLVFRSEFYVWTFPLWFFSFSYCF